MRVRLMAKLAERVEGVDLTAFIEGDTIDVPEREATLLIRGGWAEAIPDEERVAIVPAWRGAVAADRRNKS